MIKIKCTVDHITYQNEEDGFSVMKVVVKRNPGYVILVGYFPEVSEGTELLCEGDWKVDKRYGNEFVAEKWERIMPVTPFGMVKYLSSGMIKGVGIKFAHLIVKKFGDKTFDVIENDIERLNEIEGLGAKRLESIRDSWERQREIRNLMIFLQEYDVTTAYSSKIYCQYKTESIEIIKRNPYQLADDIQGIGFKTADAIANKMGYEKDDLRRCRSGILYALNELSHEGHVFALTDQLVESAKKLLEASEAVIRQVLGDLVKARELISDHDAIYFPPYYYAEKTTARLLLSLVKIPEKELLNEKINIKAIEKKTGIQYDEVQIEAIRQAVDAKVMVLTGGPGTGKTTTTQGIIAAFQSTKLKVLLAAPTGRAAKRMNETTGMEAKTIHRLLEFSPQEWYKRNEDEPLEGDVLIVDECSMIDISLMYNLVRAIPPHMRLILVGDVDQLPSVGPGNVLRDIIDSERIPVIRLTRIFRQAQSSRIVMNAHAINEGQLPDIRIQKNSDFFFMTQEDPEEVAKEIVNLVKNRLPMAYKQPVSNIQVLTPMQHGVVGTINLNLLLQKDLNHSQASLTRGAKTFKKGDRVMQLRNNYDKDIFNGDIGFVESVDNDEGILQVRFESQLVEYEVDELDELTLAYATTIHKSQGSEYPIVVMPILNSHYVMLQRNLIYTGITRAKKLCILIGQPQALAYAIRNMAGMRRNSRLKERLQEDLPNSSN